METRRVAFLDFDGTLSRGYISMEFLDYIYRNKAYPDSVYKKQMDAVDRYRTKRISYDNWCKEWGLLWADGLAGQSPDEIEGHANLFFNSFKSNIYSSSYELVSLLKEYGYRTIIVSTGASEVVQQAAAGLGIDEFYATRVRVQNGIYTNRLETDFHRPDGKKKFMAEFISSGVDMRDSLGFGDSIHDRDILENVEMPVALNPSDELKSIARERNWIILNHRNVIGYVRKLLREIR